MSSALSYNKVEDNRSQIWTDIKAGLPGLYGKDVYRNWLQNIEFESSTDNEVILSATSRFIREWVTTNYVPRLRQMWSMEDPKIKYITIVVKKPAVTEGEEPSEKKIVSGVDVTGQNIDVLDVDLSGSIGSPLDPRFTFDRFVTGDSNKLAFAAAKSVAQGKTCLTAGNPLYIHGGVGLGKTHLMHAMALDMKQRSPSTKVVYLSAERFMYHFIRSIKNKDVMSFKDSFRSIDVLLIDDIQFICGKEGTQEEFFYTINSILGQNKHLIISGDRSPADLDDMQERVRSRLSGGLVVDVGLTDFDLRLGIIQSKVDSMKDVSIPSNVVAFLARNIISNVRELEGALNKIVARSTLVEEDITVEMVKSMLKDVLRANERTITIADIQKSVAKFYDIKLSDMSSRCRSRSIARPRQVAMYLAKSLTVRSLSEIGRKFGGKDHTTVMHAVKRVGELLEKDPEFKAEVTSLHGSISG